MSALAARRRHPLMLVLLLLAGLMVTGFVYALAAPSSAGAATADSDQIAAGNKLFLSNCATCHGLHAQGSSVAPTLIGVGPAAVDFQVGTGRMPLAAPSVQAQRGKAQFNQAQIDQLAAYIASLAPGPAIPGSEYTNPQGGDIATGNEIFRTNCAMCHNFAGSGGALTRGKYAPSINADPGRYIYEAMLTGPGSMPKFTDTNISPQDKQDIIAYLHSVHTQASPGGLTLGNLGTVPEGIFCWAVGLMALIGCAVWLGSKSA